MMVDKRDDDDKPTARGAVARSRRVARRARKQWGRTSFSDDLLPWFSPPPASVARKKQAVLACTEWSRAGNGGWRRKRGREGPSHDRKSPNDPSRAVFLCRSRATMIF